MDANGVWTQIIGYGNNSPMHLSKEDGAVELCKMANDKLSTACKKYPGRFYGYATLPVDDVLECKNNKCVFKFWYWLAL